MDEKEVEFDYTQKHEPTLRAGIMVGPLFTSAGTAAVAKALCAAQKDMPRAVKDGENPHFKSSYSTLGSVMEACRESLCANGIAVIQTPGKDGDSVTVTTRLAHESGEWYQGTAYCTPKDGSLQSVMACITYLRRGGLGSMVGVASEDDDGNEASGRNSATVAAERPVQKENPTPTGESCNRTIIIDVKRYTFKRDGEDHPRWEIFTADSQKYGTFSATVADVASTFKTSGETVDLWWEMDRSGKYQNATGITPVAV